jgi:hypothetical protein
MLKFVRFETINGEEVYVNPVYVVTLEQSCPSSNIADGVCRVRIDTLATAGTNYEKTGALLVRGELEEIVARLEGVSTPVVHPPLETGDWTRRG